MDWSLPYPSQREPVMADHVVATSQPLAAQAGLTMLRRGGNAVDAAVAAAIALTVVEPTSNGIGGDLFALLWSDGGLHGLNASGKSPAALVHDGPLPRDGWLPVTVPGAVSGWVALSEQHGRLPLEDLFAPAIRYASAGFPVSRQTAAAWARAGKRFAGREDFAAAFLPAPGPGQRFRSTDHAAALAAIAQSRGEAFYRGDLAQRIAAASRAGGGFLCEADLADHTALAVTPLSVDYRGTRLHELPPNGQGIAALIAAGILAHFPGGSPDDPAWAHLQIESMKLGFRDAHAHVCDPNHLHLAPDTLLSADRLAALAAQIDPERAQDFDQGQPRPGGTVLVTAAASGQMVTLIQSNYMGFGSGAVVPGTGIAMQNRGRGFTVEPDHPNAVGGGKRPYHTIIPGFLTRGGAPLMAFGVMGGPMQPQGHLQVLSRLVDGGSNPQAALDAPRWRVEAGLSLMLEPEWPPTTVDALRGYGHDVTIAAARSVQFGGGQAILALPDGGYLGASDLRRDGQAVGF